MELSFAPLAKAESPAMFETTRSETSLTTASASFTSGAGLGGEAKEDLGPGRGRTRSERDSWRRAKAKDGVRKAISVPALSSSTR